MGAIDGSCQWPNLEPWQFFRDAGACSGILALGLHYDCLQSFVTLTGEVLTSGSSFQTIHVVAIGPNTKIVDLEGKFVTPGLIDSHVHFISGGLQVCGLDAHYCASHGSRQCNHKVHVGLDAFHQLFCLKFILVKFTYYLQPLKGLGNSGI